MPLTAPPFHAFTVKFPTLSRRILTQVGFTEAFNPSTPPPALPDEVEAFALWDTGATGSVLTHSLIAKLGLTPTGMTQVNHAGGSDTVHTYLVNIILPNMVRFAGIVVSEMPDNGQFDAIIGMDIICRGDFALTNYNQQTSLSFRVPSMEPIDYVKESNRLAFAGVGRNDPCPCGKTENGAVVKYKRCHGK